MQYQNYPASFAKSSESSLVKMALKTVKHKEARLNFAKKHIPWTQEWQNVIFSNEKKFNLDGPNGIRYY